MKTLFVNVSFLLISLMALGQSESWKQKNARINLAFTPQFEFVKIGGSYCPTAGISADVVFNNTLYIGGYFTKKIIRNYSIFSPMPTTELDVNYQHIGLDVSYAMSLGLYRTKGGHYVHPKLKIMYTVRLGGGTFWLDDKSKKKVTTREYFYYVQPQVGVAYPINDYVTLNGGICFTSALSINKLSNYFKTKDFMGPGVYIGAKISIFR